MAPPPQPLEPGQRVGPGAPFEVDAARIDRFAAALGATPDGDPAAAAPATLVIALAFDTPGGPVDLVAPYVASGAITGVVHADQQLRVYRPVRAGDRLVFSSTVRTVRRRAGSAIAAIATEVRDAGGAPVADLDATLLLTGPAA